MLDPEGQLQAVSTELWRLYGEVREDAVDLDRADTLRAVLSEITYAVEVHRGELEGRDREPVRTGEEVRDGLS